MWLPPMLPYIKPMPSLVFQRVAGHTASSSSKRSWGPLPRNLSYLELLSATVPCPPTWPYMHFMGRTSSVEYGGVRMDRGEELKMWAELRSLALVKPKFTDQHGRFCGWCNWSWKQLNKYLIIYCKHWFQEEAGTWRGQRAHVQYSKHCKFSPSASDFVFMLPFPIVSLKLQTSFKNITVFHCWPVLSGWWLKQLCRETTGRFYVQVWSWDKFLYLQVCMWWISRKCFLSGDKCMGLGSFAELCGNGNCF